MKRTVILLATLASTQLGAESPKTFSLSTAFQESVKQSESLASQEQTIRIAEAHYLQALGTVLPHLNAKASEVIQDTTTTTSGSGNSVNTTLTRRSRPEVAINLQQPLFQGFREFRSLGISTAEREKNRLNVARVKQLLFADVARAYYTVLEVEQELKIQQSIRGTLQQRILDLKNRMNLGKSRESELLATQSQLATLQAKIEATQGLVSTARDLLAFLVGHPVQQPLEDAFKVPNTLPSLDNWLAKLEQRPDRGSTHEAVRLAKGKLGYEKGDRYPTVDLNANYYPYRVGFQNDIHWDMTFSLNLPLFSGGAMRGRIREAAAQLKQTELAEQETRRRSELELTQAYHKLAAARSQETALQRAETSAKAGYQAELADYQLGLINNLNLLQSLRDLQENRLANNQAHYQTKLEYLQLLLAAGDLPPKELSLEVTP